MTSRANALRCKKIVTTILFSSVLTISNAFSAPTQFPSVLKDDTHVEKLTEYEVNTSAPIRRLQTLQFPSELINFQFGGFQTFWVTTERYWNSFWTKYSRNDQPAPIIPIDWKKESVLAVFWESKDEVVRIPTFMGIEQFGREGSKTMRVSFTLNKPCFGIITDSSPAQFIIINHELFDLDSISIRTLDTKTVGCF